VALDATPLLGARTGVGVFCAGLLEALAARPDVTAHAFAVSWRRRQGLVSIVPPGVVVRQRPMPARPLQFLWRHSDAAPIEWFTAGADVVHGTNYVVPPTRRAARVVSIHDLTMWRYPQLCDAATLAYPAFVRRALDDGAFVHTDSQFVADEVVAELGADPGRVRAIAPGIPRRPVVPASEGASSPAVRLPAGTGRYVLAVGTIEPRKDYPGLVRAFDALAAELPDVALVVVGASGWGAEAFEAALDASPFRARIVRPGFLDDGQLASLLAKAAVLAYPSVYEGFGFPPLEAMAAGVPVVATAAGSVPEVVGDGACLVAPGDPDALAAGLTRLLEDDAERGALVARGTQRASTFTWARCGEEFVRLYRSAAA
jgi:glycosyltransferase involved in cell wall biosynthesis